MSLHALAGHMASKGRGSDSMLVHMTPEEVQSLQVLALKGGGTLTINPDTGLPEANFLKKMLPMIAGFALGPAGFGLMSAGMAGAAVGGITALSTGSLSRGLMAGLGAYGGASLGGSLAGAGEGAIAAGDIAAQQAAGTFPTLAEGASQEAIAKYASDVGSLRDAALSKAGEAGFGAKMSAGFGQMASNPGAYTREMLTGLATISPVLADEGVKTATKRPDTGTIRNFTFDPYGQTYSSAGNYPASEYKGMAQGGIVALAKGGVSDQDVQNWFATNTGANDAQIAAAMQQFNVAPEQISRVTGVGMPEVQQRYETAIAPQIVGTYTGGVAGPGGTTATRGTGYLGIQDQLENAGVTAQELFNNPNYKGWSLPELEQAYNVANKIQQFDTGANSAALDDKAWANFMDTNKFSVRNIAQATGLSEAEVQRRYDAAKTVKPIITTPINTTFTTGNTQGPGTQGGGNDLTNIGSDRLFSGVSGISGAGQVGGGTVVNPNGTITTSPRIPGIPVGGFTGMKNLRDVYTERGGSLGYVNDAPENMGEFNQRFNKQTGDSLAAYEYLMGKGANPIKSGVGEIMRPYSEAVRGIPAAEGRPTQKYIYQNGRYVENPNYRPMSYNSKGERMVGLTSGEVLKGIQGLKDPADNGALFDFVSSNSISEAQLAAALGISIAEARARIAAGKKIKGVTTTAQGYDYGGGGGGDSGSAGASGDGSSGSSGTAGDAAAAAAADGAAADGPGTGAGWAYGGEIRRMALGGLGALAAGGETSRYNLGGYSDGGRLLRGPGDGVSDSIPATIGDKQPARLADGEFVVPARIVSELGNGSTEAGARKLYAMMDRVQKARGKTTGKNRVAANTRADKFLPA